MGRRTRAPWVRDTARTASESESGSLRLQRSVAKLAPPRRGYPLRSHRGGGRAHNGVRWGFKFKSLQVRAIRLGVTVFEAASSRLGAGYPQGSLSRVPFASWQRLLDPQNCFLSRCQRQVPANERRNPCESVLGGGARGHPPLGGCSKRHSHSAFGTKLQSLKRRDLC